MRRFLLAALMLGAASGARAADMPDFLRGSFSDTPAAKVNWQGYYVGGQGGMGTSDMNFTGSTQNIASNLLFDTAIENSGQVSSWPLGGKVSSHGSGFGGFVGYNSQWDDVIVGAELSYLHGKFKGSQTDSMSRSFVDSNGTTDTVTYSSSASMSISDMATLRGRAGYAFSTFLPYIFGGVALGEADIIRSVTISGTQVNAATNYNQPFTLNATDARNSRLIYGYSGGLGIDVMLLPSLFFRAEWEYVRFATSVDNSINTARVGLGYKF